MIIMLLHWMRKDLAEAMKAVGAGVGSVEDAKRVHGFRLLVAGLLWGSVYGMALGLLALPATGREVRLLLAVVPLPFFAWFLWRWTQGVRAMDELERRIQLEALAFAFPIGLALLMTLSVLEIALSVGPNDWRQTHEWLMLPLVYYVSLIWARRRYR